jgi:hypothetical protein
MSDHKKKLFRNLFKKNFICRYLPKCFSFESLTDQCVDEIFKRTTDKAIHSAPIHILCPKDEKTRRLFSLPNIISYAHACKAACDNYEEFKAKLEGSESDSVVWLKDLLFEEQNTPVISFSNAFRKFLDKVIFTGDINLSCLKTDVSHFFPSIYSHSLVWSFIGHDKSLAMFDGSEAKTDLYNKLSKLDKGLQTINKHRTNGILIGPVLSHLVAELILIDRIDSLLLKKKTTGINFFRFMDDVYVFSKDEKNLADCQKEIEESLSEFGLNLNTEKTKILKFPSTSIKVDLDVILEPYLDSLKNKFNPPASIEQNHKDFKKFLRSLLVLKETVNADNLFYFVFSYLFYDKSFKNIKDYLVENFNQSYVNIIFKIISIEPKCYKYLFEIIRTLYQNQFRDKNEVSELTKQLSDFKIGEYFSSWVESLNNIKNCEYELIWIIYSMSFFPLSLKKLIDDIGNHSDLDDSDELDELVENLRSSVPILSSKSIEKIIKADSPLLMSMLYKYVKACEDIGSDKLGKGIIKTISDRIDGILNSGQNNNVFETEWWILLLTMRNDWEHFHYAVQNKLNSFKNEHPIMELLINQNQDIYKPDFTEISYSPSDYGGGIGIPDTLTPEMLDHIFQLTASDDANPPIIIDDGDFDDFDLS